MRANLNFFKPEIPDAARLRVAVASLPTPLRKTLVLRDIEDLDCREIFRCDRGRNNMRFMAVAES